MKGGGEWDLWHWGWDLATGTGKKVAYNGNGMMSYRIYRLFETFVKSLSV